MSLPPTANSPSSVERSIRHILMVTFVLGMTGVTADLLLLDHVESWTQSIPLFVLGLALLALAAHVLLRRAGPIRLFQLVCLLLVVSAALGAFLHYRGNVEFQTDIDPAIGGATLFWKVMRAKAPPALAPMAMLQLGLVGLAWSFRHPLTRRA